MPIKKAKEDQDYQNVVDLISEPSTEGLIVQLVQLNDEDAPNNTLYYSLTISKAAYKDFSGVVNPLY